MSAFQDSYTQLGHRHGPPGGGRGPPDGGGLCSGEIYKHVPPDGGRIRDVVDLTQSDKITTPNASRTLITPEYITRFLSFLTSENPFDNFVC